MYHILPFQLAQVLQVETELVKQAVSLYCRLGFARKLDPETEQSRAKRHPSWSSLPAQTVRYVCFQTNRDEQFVKTVLIQRQFK